MASPPAQEPPVPPFKHSLPARLLLAAAAIVTIGGGLASIVGVNPHWGLPMFMVAGGLTALVGIVIGIHDYAPQVLMAALIGPVFLWPITMMVVQIGAKPSTGWVLLSLGVLPVGFFVAAMRSGDAHPPPARKGSSSSSTSRARS
jgi:hypothetical protein